MSESHFILFTQNLEVGYSTKKNSRTVLEGLDLNLQAGELTCLLGPNGSGKSTLMRTLSGIQKPLGGKVVLDGSELNHITSKELAKKLSVVLTDRTTPGNLTSYALVSLGRFPYSSWMGNLTDKDKKQVQWAMQVTGTEEFADIHVGELSDGERQKVMIARALAQDTPIIFLDEPTAHLDLPNRLEVFHLLSSLAKDSGKAILLTSHEMDLALSSASNLWLINQERSIVSGVPEDLVINGDLENAFSKDGLTFNYEDGNFTKNFKGKGKAVSLEGPEILVKWTKRALDREGYQVVTSSTDFNIHIQGSLGHAQWIINEDQRTYKTIEQLLKAIRE